MTEFAPIALFVYNRPVHTKAVLNSLANCFHAKKSVLYIFCDGPKKQASAKDIQSIKEVREIVKAETRFLQVIIEESQTNKGLANAILEGVTKVIQKHGKIIVVEDDLVVSPMFLEYMNKALNKFEKNQTVACITGYVYPLKSEFKEAFFIKGADCWTWATWANRWSLYEQNSQELYNKIITLKKEKDFTFNNSYPYLEMLKNRAEEKNQSWAINWYASAFINSKLCLYPPKTLVYNIGNDGSGTHFTGKTDIYNEGNPETFEVILPDRVIESLKGRKAFENFFRGSSNPLLTRLKNKLLNIKNRVLSKKEKNGWHGDFKTWKEAAEKSSGYDTSLILNKVKQAVLKVKSGEAAYERDSVVFNEVYIFSPVLNALKNSVQNNSLHICDYGGALGSVYFQYRNYFNELNDFKWAVVEQKHFVETGKNEISEKALNFYFTIPEVLQVQKNQLLLLSSVLPYIADPFSFIKEILKNNFQYILIDRTGFIKRSSHRITIQYVPEHIYKASYPAWFFNEAEFLKLFEEDYLLLDMFINEIPPPMKVDSDDVYWKGFYFKRKNG